MNICNNRAELGNAAWKLLHTTLARFPKKPTVDEREALNSYLHLFARLYPCGECAAHFQLLLRKYPPQTGSRDAASQWGCFVHNHVNDRLRKPLFDCGTVSEAYKCGCADADADSAADVEGAQAAGVAAAAKGTSEGSGLPTSPSSPIPPTAAKPATITKGSTTETPLEENIRNAPKGARVEIEKGPKVYLPYPLNSRYFLILIFLLKSGGAAWDGEHTRLIGSTASVGFI